MGHPLTSTYVLDLGRPSLTPIPFYWVLVPSSSTSLTLRWYPYLGGRGILDPLYYYPKEIRSSFSTKVRIETFHPRNPTVTVSV